MGVANLGIAIGKTPELLAGVEALGVTGVGAPVAAVLGAYGSTSIFGQGLAGTAQLYSAFTGNYGMPAQVAQIGNILSGPASGVGTLALGGSYAKAERYAAYESFFSAGAGAVNRITQGAVGLALADYGASSVGIFPPPENACGGGHR